ncbi:hypothetical protein Lalb_Chr03g0035961 [Lupinus albus]|uniref:Uncharacterized protein n=1 Tax=Lupinus albus TaxID=3870 RepID=A0A6A4QRU3_LUPAL|nr:hypothetical protein Lalb_Chr03g0035961 [Lupinus albus]
MTYLLYFSHICNTLLFPFCSQSQYIYLVLLISFSLTNSVHILYLLSLHIFQLHLPHDEGKQIYM